MALASGLALLVHDDDVDKLARRLDYWYALVEGDWNELVRWVAHANERVISALFGKQIFSWRFVLSATGVSGALSVTSLVLAVLWMRGSSTGFDDVSMLVRNPMVMSGLTLNCAIDVTTLALTRSAFRLFNATVSAADFETLAAERKPSRLGGLRRRVVRWFRQSSSQFVRFSQRAIWLPLCVVFAAFYLPGVVTVLMWAIITQEPTAHLIEAFFWPLFVVLNANNAALLVVVLPATYSSLLFVTSLFLAAVLDRTRAFTRRPLVAVLRYCRKEPFRVWLVSFFTLNAVVNVSATVLPDVLPEAWHRHSEKVSAHPAASKTLLLPSAWTKLKGTWLGDDFEEWKVEVVDSQHLRFSTPKDHRSIHTAWLGGYKGDGKFVLPAEKYGSTIEVQILDADRLCVRYVWEMIGPYSVRDWELRRPPRPKPGEQPRGWPYEKTGTSPCHQPMKPGGLTRRS